ncbi:hypothetical protein PED39_04985 [Methanomassiliicoccales archaeon LGM-RCC1]|nr:hypothetical protein [Candidatus Methanomethylophilaceae archaeon]WII06945.1 hypothetical protein PED39_04985 [Methanomassiliicoccales archaeon LGM-RCC1]
MSSDKNRPVVISIVAILNFLIGLFFLAGGIVMALGIIDISAHVPEMAEYAALGGGIVILIGIIYLVIAGGMWNGWKIMWYIGVIVNGLSLIMGIATIFVGSFVGIIPLVIDAIILYYLFRPGVKEFFGI